MRSILGSLLLLSITRTMIYALSLPEPICLESESYSRATTDYICPTGKQMTGGLCYYPCQYGYERDMVRGIVICTAINCPSGYSSILGVCTKICDGACTPICAPWPFEDDCTRVCAPDYPCGTTTRHAYSLQGSSSVCPSNYENYLLSCREICARGYTPAMINDCDCDIQIYYTDVADFITTLTNNMQTEINTLITNSLQPFNNNADVAHLESIFTEDRFDEAYSLLNPYLGGIISFLRALRTKIQSLFGSRRRFLEWTDPVIVLEITASAHLYLGVSAGVGFYVNGLNLYAYAFGCYGQKTDAEIALSYVVTIFGDAQNVVGKSKVIGMGIDIGFGGAVGIDVFIVKERDVPGSPDIIGFGFSIGAGFGVSPIEFSAQNCETTDVLKGDATAAFH